MRRKLSFTLGTITTRDTGAEQLYPDLESYLAVDRRDGMSPAVASSGLK